MITKKRFFLKFNLAHHCVILI